jgi:hypothetical protein
MEAPVRLRILPVAVEKTPQGEVLYTAVEFENFTNFTVSYSATYQVATDRGDVVIPSTAGATQAAVASKAADSAELAVGRGLKDGFYVVHAEVSWSAPKGGGTTGDQMFLEVEHGRVYVLTADDYHLYSSANEGVRQP